jgi:hypothetical protein
MANPISTEIRITNSLAHSAFFFVRSTIQATVYTTPACTVSMFGQPEYDCSNYDISIGDTTPIGIVGQAGADNTTYYFLLAPEAQVSLYLKHSDTFNSGVVWAVPEFVYYGGSTVPSPLPVGPPTFDFTQLVLGPIRQSGAEFNIPINVPVNGQPAQIAYNVSCVNGISSGLKMNYNASTANPNLLTVQPVSPVDGSKLLSSGIQYVFNTQFKTLVSDQYFASPTAVPTWLSEYGKDGHPALIYTKAQLAECGPDLAHTPVGQHFCRVFYQRLEEDSFCGWLHRQGATAKPIAGLWMNLNVLIILAEPVRFKVYEDLRTTLPTLAPRP